MSENETDPPPPPPPPRPLVDTYVGDIRLIPFTFAPVGWMFCDGAELPVSDYNELFAVIGTAYGGDGRVNFKLPNLKGRAPVGMGQNPQFSSLNPGLGGQGGQSIVTLTEANLAPHGHTISAYKDLNQDAIDGPAAFFGPSASAVAGDPNPTLCYSEATNALVPLNGDALMPSHAHSAEIYNLQPYLTLNYIIAVEGLFPPRP